jgi:hypothetical protein
LRSRNVYSAGMSDQLLKRRSVVLGVLAAPLASMASEPSWSELVRISRDYTGNCMRDLESRHHLSEIERWDLDDEIGRIVFSTAGRPILVTQFQFTGSVSRMSGTWLWSWANDSMPALLSRDMARVRDYGERRGFSRLTRPQWKANEKDGWDMTCVANFLLNGKGVYRPPGRFGVSYVVLTDVKRASGA